MHSPSLTTAALLLALSSAPSAAADPKVGAVQLAALAQLAPLTCEGMSTDQDAVAAFLAKAGVTDADLHGALEGAVRDAAAALASSAGRDRTAACSQLWNQLGDDGLGLVTGPEDEDGR